MREHFSNKRSFAFGAGVAALTAMFGAQVSQWPHPVAIGFGYGSGLVLTGGSLWAILRSVLKADSEYHPKLLTLAVHTTGLTYQDMKWDICMGGRSGVVAVVTNEYGTKRSGSSAVSHLAASLHFSDASGSRRFIQKAFWLGSVVNETELSVGATKRILIGIDDFGVFAVTGNEHESDPRSDGDNQHVIFASVPMRLETVGDLRVTVKLYSTQSGIVFDNHDFVVPRYLGIVNRSHNSFRMGFHQLWRHFSSHV